MNRLVLITCLLLGNSVIAQNDPKREYIILEENGDTIEVDEFEEIQVKHLVVNVAGKSQKYLAKEIRRFNFDDRNYEAGQIKLPGWVAKEWAFLRISLEGKMMMYDVMTTYYYQGRYGGTSSKTLFLVFAKLKSQGRDEYVSLAKGWKKKMIALGSDCTKFVEEAKKVKKKQINHMRRLGIYYNDNCGT